MNYLRTGMVHAICVQSYYSRSISPGENPCFQLGGMCKGAVAQEEIGNEIYRQRF
jgi:hypothetical protein